MAQEEKQLLLQDLCARLPYGVIMRNRECENDFELDGRTELTLTQSIKYSIEKFRAIPYLRPMLSMTEEELDELLDCEDIDFDGKSELVKRAMLAFAEGDKLLSNALFSMQYAKTVDWLNAHHFDYRGLIKKGLALEAPEGMYVIK